MRRLGLAGPVLLLAAAALLGACSLAEDVTPPPGADALAPVIPSGPQTEATDSAPAAPSQPPDVAAGAAIYLERCEPCHGATGMGDGSQAANLPNPAARLGDPALGRRAVPADWYSIVTVGNMERFMPGFASLSDQQRWDVVGYALTLSVDTARQQAAAGVYAAECAGCHGADGDGGAAGPALSSPSALAGLSLEAAYQVISQGAGERMPGYGDQLGEDERWALSAYVRSLAFAPGQEPEAGSISPTVDEPAMPSAETGTPEAASSPTAEAAAPTGVVSGRVVQGTEGGSPPGDLEVSLHAFDGQSEVLSQTAVAGAAGTFEFDGLEIVPGRLYVVAGDYQGVPYASEPVHLSETGAADDVILAVYETTQDRQALQIERMHVLVNFAGDGLVELIQLWLLSNGGDRTVTAPEGEAVVTVDLPEAASNLTFEEGTETGRILMNEAGFGDSLPVRPGPMTAQLVFSYVLPYDGELDFSQPVPLAVAGGVVIAPEGGPRLSGQGLQDAGVRQMSGSSVHTYTLGPIDAGGALAFSLEGRLSGAASAGNDLSSVAIGAGVLGVALIAAGLWWFRRPLGGQSPSSEAGSSLSRDELLRRIASLDEAHEAGALDQAEYQARRTALKRQVMERMRDARD